MRGRKNVQIVATLLCYNNKTDEQYSIRRRRKRSMKLI